MERVVMPGCSELERDQRQVGAAARSCGRHTGHDACQPHPPIPPTPTHLGEAVLCERHKADGDGAHHHPRDGDEAADEDEEGEEANSGDGQGPHAQAGQDGVHKRDAGLQQGAEHGREA